MDNQEALSLLRIAVAFVVLTWASLLDWKTRKVDNRYWIGLSILAMALLPIQIIADKEKIEYLLILVPIAAILSDVYLDSGRDSTAARFAPFAKYGIALASIIVIGYLWVDVDYFQHLIAIPILMLLIVVLYMADIIRGGADAKALLSLTILFPFHPELEDFPLLRGESASIDVIMPFSLIVLINAAIVVVLLPIGFLAKNLVAGDMKLPQALLGYKMNCEDIKRKHVWLMERMENGTHRIYVRPRSNENLAKEVEELVMAGHKRVWITPKIPFIIPLLISLVISTIVGNLLLLLIPL